MRTVLVVCAVVAVLIAAYFGLRPPAAPEVAVARPDVSAVADLDKAAKVRAVAASPQAPDAEPAALAAVAPAADGRVPVAASAPEPAPLRIRVRDTAGGAVAGATVSWHTLDNDVLGFYPTPEASQSLWLLADRNARLLSDDRFATTDAAGGARLTPPARATPDLSTVVWASHPTFAAACVVLGPEANPSDVEIALAAAPAARAHVVDAQGRGVAGAQVLQIAFYEPVAGPDADPFESRARRALLRRFETGADGFVSVHAVAGPQVWLAQADAGRAVEWTTGPGVDHTLNLADVFELTGEVETAGGVTIGMWAIVEVDALFNDGSRRRVAGLPVAQDGSFGPVAIPRPAGVRAFRAGFDYGECMPDEVEFAPAQGARAAHVRLRTSPANLVWVFMFDARDSDPKTQGLPGVRVGLVADVKDESGAVRRVSSERISTAQGWLNFVVDASQFSLWATKPGWGRVEYNTLAIVPDAVGTPLQIGMVPATALRGRATRGGVAVGDYKLRIQSAAVGGRWFDWIPVVDPEGRFEIPDMAPGRYQLTAVVGGIDFSAPVDVDVAAPEGDGGAVNVELAFGEARPLVGRILGRVDGKPVADAAVEVFLPRRGLTPAVSPGPSARSDAEGRFGLESVAYDVCSLLLEAPGFLPRIVDLRDLDPSAPEQILRLDPTMGIELQLEGDGLRDTSAYTAQLTSPADWQRGIEREVFRFDADGRARLEGASPGHSFHLYHPERWREVRWIPRNSKPGEVVPIPLSPHAFHVRFVDGAGEPMGVSGELSMHFFDIHGQSVSRYFPVRLDRSVLAPGVPASRADLHFIATLGQKDLHGFAALEITADMQEVLLTVSEASLRIHAVDQSGAPVDGVQLHIAVLPPFGDASSRAYVADRNGRLAIALGTPTRVGIWAGDREGVHHPLQEYSVPGPDHDVSYVVAPPAPLTIHVREDGRALDGARIVASVPLTQAPAATWHTDAAGDVRVQTLAPGRWGINLLQSGIWRAESEFEIGPAGATVHLEAYTLVDFAIRLVRADGTAAAGVDIELQHLELEGSVAEWIEDSRAKGSLRSSPTGEARFVGLPRGRYRVTAGAIAQGIDVKVADVAPYVLQVE